MTPITRSALFALQGRLATERIDIGAEREFLEALGAEPHALTAYDATVCDLARREQDIAERLSPRPLPARMASLVGYAEDDEPARGDEVRE